MYIIISTAMEHTWFSFFSFYRIAKLSNIYSAVVYFPHLDSLKVYVYINQKTEFKNNSAEQVNTLHIRLI